MRKEIKLLNYFLVVFEIFVITLLGLMLVMFIVSGEVHIPGEKVVGVVTVLFTLNRLAYSELRTSWYLMMISKTFRYEIVYLRRKFNY